MNDTRARIASHGLQGPVIDRGVVACTLQEQPRVGLLQIARIAADGEPAVSGHQIILIDRQVRMHERAHEHDGRAQDTTHANLQIEHLQLVRVRRLRQPHAVDVLAAQGHKRFRRQLPVRRARRNSERMSDFRGRGVLDLDGVARAAIRVLSLDFDQERHAAALGRHEPGAIELQAARTLAFFTPLSDLFSGQRRLSNEAKH